MQQSQRPVRPPSHLSCPQLLDQCALQNLVYKGNWRVWGLRAVCGSFGGFVQITDNGDGTCFAFTTESGVRTPIPNCASPAYPALGTCNSMRSDMKVTIRRASGAPYVQPNIAKWLTQMGLNNISVSIGTLIVEVNHSPVPIPSAIAPSFLPFIRQVCQCLTVL